jgi:hypothetical protein
MVKKPKKKTGRKPRAKKKARRKKSPAVPLLGERRIASIEFDHWTKVKIALNADPEFRRMEGKPLAILRALYADWLHPDTGLAAEIVKECVDAVVNFGKSEADRTRAAVQVAMRKALDRATGLFTRYTENERERLTTALDEMDRVWPEYAACFGGQTLGEGEALVRGGTEPTGDARPGDPLRKRRPGGQQDEGGWREH